jgi:hypothetical protein
LKIRRCNPLVLPVGNNDSGAFGTTEIVPTLRRLYAVEEVTR